VALIDCLPNLALSITEKSAEVNPAVTRTLING